MLTDEVWGKIYFYYWVLVPRNEPFVDIKWYGWRWHPPGAAPPEPRKGWVWRKPTRREAERRQFIFKENPQHFQRVCEVYEQEFI